MLTSGGAPGQPALPEVGPVTHWPRRQAARGQLRPGEGMQQGWRGGRWGGQGCGGQAGWEPRSDRFPAARGRDLQRSSHCGLGTPPSRPRREPLRCPGHVAPPHIWRAAQAHQDHQACGQPRGSLPGCWREGLPDSCSGPHRPRPPCPARHASNCTQESQGPPRAAALPSCPSPGAPLCWPGPPVPTTAFPSLPSPASAPCGLRCPQPRSSDALAWPSCDVPCHRGLPDHPPKRHTRAWEGADGHTTDRREGGSVPARPLPLPGGTRRLVREGPQSGAAAASVPESLVTPGRGGRPRQEWAQPGGPESPEATWPPGTL